jgi:PKD repeat protein
VPYDTVPAPTTPWVAPGTYTVKLTVDGKTYSQPIVVKPDPRVKTSALAMQQVYTLSRAMYDEALAVMTAADAARKAGKPEDAQALTDTVNGVNGLASVLNILQAADVPPTAVQLKAIADARHAASAALAKSSLPQPK